MAVFVSNVGDTFATSLIKKLAPGLVSTSTTEIKVDGQRAPRSTSWATLTDRLGLGAVPAKKAAASEAGNVLAKKLKKAAKRKQKGYLSS